MYLSDQVSPPPPDFFPVHLHDILYCGYIGLGMRLGVSIATFLIVCM